jgi:hypothetical protein
MSTEYVRAQFRAVLANALPLPWVFVESINTAYGEAELPVQWVTLDFPPVDEQRISLGSPGLFRESGAPQLLIFTAQQLGDGLAVQAAEQLRTVFLNWKHDASGHLRVLSCSPPQDLDGGDFRGAWFGESVDIRYEFDSIK